MYHNTRTTNIRQKRQSLIIDIDIGGQSDTSFSMTLQEPLIIDSLSDIYLDNFTTFKIRGNNDTNNFSPKLPTTHINQPDTLLIILGIDQFNIKTSSNDQLLWDKIIIPNEATLDSETFSQKSKKNNYICSINPTILENITGTIMNLNSIRLKTSSISRAILLR